MLATFQHVRTRHSRPASPCLCIVPSHYRRLRQGKWQTFMSIAYKAYTLVCSNPVTVATITYDTIHALHTAPLRNEPHQPRRAKQSCRSIEAAIHAHAWSHSPHAYLHARLVANQDHMSDGSGLSAFLAYLCVACVARPLSLDAHGVAQNTTDVTCHHTTLHAACVA